MESYTEYVFERDLEKIAKEFSNSLKENGNLWYGEYSADKRKVFLEKIKSCYILSERKLLCLPSR